MRQSMRQLQIDFDDIQKASEDTERDSFEYFLDIDSGEVVVISHELMDEAERILHETYDDDLEGFDEVEVEQEPDLPVWMEDEVELAMDVYMNHDLRYVRIPERDSAHVFSAMRQFTESVEDDELKNALRTALDGAGAFRKFKNELAGHPAERKKWYAYNSKVAKQEITQWLMTIGIRPGSMPSA